MPIKPFQPIEKLNGKATLADQVHASLRHAVIQGHLRPFSKLNQIELSKDLDVSERTVREALARLVSEGLVNRAPYKEFRVVGPSVDEIEEIFQMRALLEGWAMELAASEISQEELDQMRKLLPQIQAKISPEALVALQGENRQFHWIAISACRKNYLIQMLRRLWDQMLPYAFAEEDTESYVRQTQEDHVYHHQLMEALEAGDGKKAREILITHVHQSMEQLRLRAQQLEAEKD